MSKKSARCSQSQSIQCNNNNNIQYVSDCNAVQMLWVGTGEHSTI